MKLAMKVLDYGFSATSGSWVRDVLINRFLPATRNFVYVGLKGSHNLWIIHQWETKPAVVQELEA